MKYSSKSHFVGGVKVVDSIIEKELEPDIETDDEEKNESKITTEEIKTQKSPYKIITFLIIGLFSISLFLNYLLLRWRSKYKNQLMPGFRLISRETLAL